MVTKSNLNHRTIEHNRIDDLYENAINVYKLNATKLERDMVRVNTGSKRRLRNNHDQRLQAFKQRNIT